MTDPDEALSAIDAAIEGWTGYDGTVSADAMRWTPEAPESTWHGAHLGRVFVAPQSTVVTNATPDGSWTEIGFTTEDWGVLGEPDSTDEVPPTWPTRSVSQTFTLTPEQMETFRHAADHIQRQHDTFRRAFQGFAKSILKGVGRTHAAMAPATYGDAYRRHRRNCRAYNPAGNPKPLKVNGADYARRRKNRRRRVR